MRIIARRTLSDFVKSKLADHDCQALRNALDAWYEEVRKAKWSNMAEVKRHYATASVISMERVVFNIKGNSYRLVASFDFDRSIAFIKWIGTHRDYDKLDVRKVQYGG